MKGFGAVPTSFSECRTAASLNRFRQGAAGDRPNHSEKEGGAYVMNLSPDLEGPFYRDFIFETFTVLSCSTANNLIEFPNVKHPDTHLSIGVFFAYQALNWCKFGVNQPHHLQKIQQFQGLAATS